MKILVINGANINTLGIRETEIYGNKTYKELVRFIKSSAKELQIKVKCFQSNYEGKIIEKIQKAYKKFDGIIINAGAYSHTSIAILDALKSSNLKTVEVHLTDIEKRESFRAKSYISLYAEKVIIGKGFIGYKEGLQYFCGKMK